MLLIALILNIARPCIAAADRNHAGTPAVRYEAMKDAVTRLIKTEMKKNDVVGLSIALVDDQQIVWAQGFGYADEKYKITATPETIYNIGSLTKVFTATAAMQLAEQGMIDVDLPLQKYIPEFSVKTRFPNTSQITLRHLMTHHSGLPSNLQKGMWSGKPEPFASIVGMLKEEYAATPPGLIFSYSNVGMALAGIAVERVSGSDYPAFIQASLLGPMHMFSSGFALPRSLEKMSKGYHKGNEMEDPLIRDLPAGGLRSNVLDLSQYIKMMFDQGRSNSRQVVKPSTLVEMLTKQNTAVPLDLGLRVGLGWMLSGLGDIDIQNAGIVAHHAGSTILFHSMMIVLPEHKLGVVVLANSSTSHRTANKAAVQAITLALEAKTGIKQPEPKKPVPITAVLLPELMRDYVGMYASMAGLAEIIPKDEHFHTEVMGRTFQLDPHGNNRFGIKYRVLGIFEISLGELDYYEVSHARIGGREILKAGTKGRDMLIAEKIHPAPVPPAWLKRIGEYQIENLGDDFPVLDKVRLRLQDGLLIAECTVPFFYKGTVRFPLTPVSDTEAVIAGLGRGMGETIRVISVNNRELLAYSGYVLKMKQ